MTPRTPRDERIEDLSRRADRAGRMLLAVVWIAVGVMVILFLVGVLAGKAQSRDLGQWPDNDLTKWYQSLMQPDVPTASCCGPADAYFADDVHVRDGKTYVTITDDRPDEPRGRPHVEIGTEIEVPPNKLKWDAGNPTGHGVVFISRGGYVFCYVQNGGY